MKPPPAPGDRRPAPWRACGLPLRRQQGALTIIAGASIVVLIGMLALVLDLAHLYIAKTELQNAADACALSAAGELAQIDADPGITVGRATSAGIGVGSRNRVDLQGQPADIAPLDITFSAALNGPYSRDIVSGTRYVRCTPQATNGHGIAMWFAGVLGVSALEVGAEAVARVDNRADTCALPLALCTSNSAAGNMGFTIGQWTSGRMAAGTAQTGNYDWIDFKGLLGTKLSDTIAGSGQCDLPPSIDTVLAQKGITGAAQAWNTRFGLYGGTYKDAALYRTDTTGFAYTTRSWPLGRDAFSALFPQNFPNQEARYEPYNPDAIVDSKGNPVNFPGNPQPSLAQVHAAGTIGRRIVVMPVIKCADWDPNGKDEPVVGWACGLMLAPISDPNTDVQMEIIRVTLAPEQQPCNGVPGVGGEPIHKLVR